MSYLVLGCQGVLVGVFLVSIVGKLRGRGAYREFVSATASLLAAGHRTARVLAPLTITAECTVVLALALPGAARLGFAMAAALLCCFSVALVRAIRRGSAAPCRCFGASSTPVSSHHVVRNIVLIATAAAGVIIDLAVDSEQLEPAGVAVVGLAVLACVLLIARLDDLVTLLRSPAERW